ncbi:MAG: hypothetical protein ACE5FD_06590 [Anaerolineae bacterium]
MSKDKAQNPVVLLDGEVWHVVEDGRRSDHALCGQKLTHRRAHTRLKRVGLERLCARCRQLLDVEPK